MFKCLETTINELMETGITTRYLLKVCSCLMIENYVIMLSLLNNWLYDVTKNTILFMQQNCQVFLNLKFNSLEIILKIRWFVHFFFDDRFLGNEKYMVRNR